MNFPGTPSKALAMALLFFLLPVFNTAFRSALNANVPLKSEEAPRCDPPSEEIKDLGCVLLIDDTALPWGAQRNNCQNRGGRLLEGFTREQFRELRKIFKFEWGLYWIGIRKQRWYPSSEPIVGLDNMWKDKSFACGGISYSVPDVQLTTSRCEDLAYAVCLFNYKI